MHAFYGKIDSLKTMRLSLLFILFGSVFQLAVAQVELKISLIKSPIYVGQRAECSVALTNKGNEPVVLVLPGDGSTYKMRTPFVGWSVISGRQSKRDHPAEPPLPKEPRECANINPLMDEEVFTLGAGETRTIDNWVFGFHFTKPGRYRMVFYYHNDPSIPFEGYRLTEKRMMANPALRKMSNSTKCLLRSNEVVVEVVRAPK